MVVTNKKIKGQAKMIRVGSNLEIGKQKLKKEVNTLISDKEK